MFVGRGFSHDIQPMRVMGLQPLKNAVDFSWIADMGRSTAAPHVRKRILVKSEYLPKTAD
jgi:hypothetical protein